jgi:transposase-like protein
MLIFPLAGLLDEQACYDWLVETLHPNGLCCRKGHPLPEGQKPHDRHRAPVMDYRCGTCGGVYNLFSDTVLKGIRWPCSTIILMLKGFTEGTPSKHLAQELKIDRIQLMQWRHRVQALLQERLSPLCLAGSGHRGRRDVPERR